MERFEKLPAIENDVLTQNLLSSSRRDDHTKNTNRKASSRYFRIVCGSLLKLLR